MKVKDTGGHHWHWPLLSVGRLTPPAGSPKFKAQNFWDPLTGRTHSRLQLLRGYSASLHGPPFLLPGGGKGSVCMCGGHDVALLFVLLLKGLTSSYRKWCLATLSPLSLCPPAKSSIAFVHSTKGTK